MPLDLSSWEKALKRSEEFPEDDVTRDACIQRFEYTFELSWKMLKRQIEEDVGHTPEIDSYSKKNLFRVGGERGLIPQVERWFVYLEKRNLTTHTYDEENAQEVFKVIADFAKDTTDLFNKRKAKNKTP